jgi:hypothetical protein
MQIKMMTLPHEAQRYPTVGDYFKVGATDVITVSQMYNHDYEFLVGLHELIEMYLTQKRGIAEEDISAFDIEYERNRKEGDVSEPGNDPKAPYFTEQQFATKIERMVADELGVNWDAYDEVVGNL